MMIMRGRAAAHGGFFIENLDFGLTLKEAERNTLSIVASPDYDRVFFYLSDLQNIFVGGFTGSRTAM
jgi:hypothetical protein